MEDLSVGIIANPVASRDIRRVVAHAGNVSVHDRANTILRILIGLSSSGINNIWMMPEHGGIRVRLERELARARKLSPNNQRIFPQLNTIDIPVTRTEADTRLAARYLNAKGVGAIIILGGDGTHRLVVSEQRSVPITGISTGTNNAFPKRHEPTILGLVIGLVLRKIIPPSLAYMSNKILEVSIGNRKDIALVDAAVLDHGYVGTRAVWDASVLRELFVTFGEPHAIGLSSAVGLLNPVSRDDPHGCYVRFSDKAVSNTRLRAPIGPGQIETLGIAEWMEIEPGKSFPIQTPRGVIALDGEREIPFSDADRLSVMLIPNAFRSIAIEDCIKYAATNGCFLDPQHKHLRQQKERYDYHIN